MKNTIRKSLAIFFAVIAIVLVNSCSGIKYGKVYELTDAPADEYESLQSALKSHYKGDRRVSDVFINKGGTVVVDCR